MGLRQLATWAWLLLAAASCPAAEFYVTPSGAGLINGTDWDNAFSNVQAAADLATNAGDKIYLQWGVYSNASQIVISNAAGLTVFGGCVGEGASSNAYSGTNSVLTRSADVTNRILFSAASTVRVEGVTFSGGIGVNINGAGLFLTNGAWTLDRCVVENNEALPATNTVSGAGLYMAMGTLTMSNCVVANNKINLIKNYCSGYGGGMRLDQVEVDFRNVHFESNCVHWIKQEVQTAAGGAIAIYNTGVERTILSNVVFCGNHASAVWSSQFGGSAHGGAVCLRGGDATLASCVFSGNYSRGQSASYGGAVNAGVMNALLIGDCAFRGCYAQSPGSGARGGALYLSGVTNASLSDSSIRETPLIGEAEGIRIDSATSRLCMQNCAIENSTLDGIGMSAGQLRLTNCLVAQSAANGLYLMGGTASAHNVTFADNAGWGLNRTGGAASIGNSIAWGNGLGGIASNANVSVEYTCCQNELAGESNRVADPLFIHSYYLSVAGLAGQTASSPFIAYGNASPAELGLTNFTTRTDGRGDTNAWVDLGYHYTNGVSGEELSNAVLYVDAQGGNDTNDGWTAGTALKTLGAGLARIMARGTIRLAAGTYDAANGETFPLTVNRPYLSIEATNRDLTVIDAGGASRVFYAVNRGGIRLASMVIQGGAQSNDHGGGVYAVGCELTLSNCAVINNQLVPASSSCYGSGLYLRLGKLAIANCVFSNNFINLIGGSSGYGGAMFIDRSPLTIRSTRFENNRIDIISGQSHTAAGGAIYSAGADVEIADAEFIDNHASAVWSSQFGGSAHGGAVYLRGGDATLTSCVFSGNYSRAQSASYGGAVNAGAMNALLIGDCAFRGCYAQSPGSGARGGALYLSGVTNASLSDSSIRETPLIGEAEGIRIDSATSRLCMQNCAIENSTLDGIGMSAGQLRLTNCLVAQSAANGLYLMGGTASAHNVTFADNAGWGLNRTGGAASIGNSIAWGNGLGGIASNANVSVEYTCCQNELAGESNRVADPLFIHSYYLSVAGLAGQTASSPFIAYGNASPAELGLTNFTTRTDGRGDTNAWVDLGYHYTNGVSGEELSNAVLYVDAQGGNDTNDGWTAGTALKTLGAGLARIMARGTIRLAAGTYDAANGETFPLTVNRPYLSIEATNRDLTVIDAGGASRVFYAVNRGGIRLASMVIQGGAQSNDHGGGVYAVGCELTLSNCAVINNQLVPASSSCYGSGLYLRLGKLAIANCVFSNNFINLIGGSSGYGGAMFIDRSPLTIRSARFENNRVERIKGESHTATGGAIYSAGADVEIADAGFCGNYATAAPSGMWGGSAYGGALYFTQGNATLHECTFSNNYASSRNTTRGGCAYMSTVTNVILRDCAFVQGYAKSFVTGVCGGGALYLMALTTDMTGCRIQGVGTASGSKGDTYIGSGTVRMTHTLIAGNNGDGVAVLGPGTLNHCVLAHNAGWGMARYAASALTIRDSIVWGNSFGGIEHNQNLALGYSCNQDSLTATLSGEGNFSADPLFVDSAAGDFHLQSTAGSWHGGAWTPDARLSPCIDAGDPASDWSLEPKPSGGRVNLGAYGNTQEASKSTRGTVFWAR